MINKNYNSEVGELMPLILSTTLKVAIVIVNRDFRILNIIKPENLTQLDSSNTTFVRYQSQKPNRFATPTLKLTPCKSVLYI